MKNEPNISRDYAVEGVDTDDGSRCELASFDYYGEAEDYFLRYVRCENAGGWDHIEVVDMRDGSTIKRWERQNDE